jgi:crotonobetainyl-CoA:carnitine CoA-transferase CaiB-like acyl-CoA transferase
MTADSTGRRPDQGAGRAGEGVRNAGRSRPPAPLVAEHADEILQLLGYDDAERCALRDTGIV